MSNYASYSVTLLLGNGDGTFTAAANQPVGGTPWGIVAAPQPLTVTVAVSGGSGNPTPTGSVTYNITVTATSGVLSHSTTITLTVQ